MKVCVIGTGYVGLVAGACFADSGNTVICVDIDKEKIEKLKKGIIPIYEPGLQEIVLKNVEKERLFFTTEIKEGVEKSDIIFIAVGTPEGEDGSADLSYVLQAARDIAKHMNGYKIIVNKSTVPVGTAEKVRKEVEKITNHPFDVVSNPEFLKEGAAVQDFLKPDRIVIGTNSEKARKIMVDLYSPFVRKKERIILMDNVSAELTKYAANSMLATRISFMNDLANLAEKVGADIEKVRIGIGTDSRIGLAFLFPGVGYGGSCFPKDVKAILKTGEEYGHKLSIIDAVERLNKEQRKIMVDRVTNFFKGDIKGKTFAIWGLSFKPNTDDMREAPAIDIIKGLVEKGAKIQAYDPVAMENAKKVFSRLGINEEITYCPKQYGALQDADALIVVTEWMEFRKPDFELIKKLMAGNTIFDGRNIYKPEQMKELGFNYFSIGRKPVIQG
ncbi:UDPglucose 6-dehydrogenase [Thermotomaculum hydrothermale]|uniref:UDP-glucose 6-dehydrogenase n=1 Tax=Thermotomaculum hydrothermale TaxID=981385 RepID=A0A7R6Q103_9BACT|nr:UDP-glucose/GDP-mannose dehydrogenase family protein [Thermotomaculum hydrothermale]BBB33628.1 UDPglucose 6-dehydrogenase [Thermotomaculum hydrothermale]